MKTTNRHCITRPLAAIILLLLYGSAHAQTPPETQTKPRADAPAAETTNAPAQRTQLNLLGQTDTSSGESRRNENVQFNLIDNNALRELNLRVGTTATLVPEFRAERNFFGAEYGSPPAPSLHLPSTKSSGVHGSLFETHNNSVFSARSFFQVGGVKPARENNYGFNLGAPLWRNGYLFVEASQQKVRGFVNGNVLVPKSDERTPLTNDLALRRIIERFFAAFPNEAPNRTEIDQRALNTNAPQRIDTNAASARLDHLFNSRNQLSLRHAFTGQDVNPFQFVAGQNPDTFTKSHTGRITWQRTWSASTAADFSLGFDRVTSLLRPEKNAVGPTVSFGGALTGLGPAPPIPINRALNNFRYAAAAQHTRQDHRFSFGAELTRTQINGSEPDGDRGILSFTNLDGRDAITNLRLGIPAQYTLAVGATHRGFRNWVVTGYAGDYWRASARLQLSFGLRYNVVTRPNEINGLNEFPFDCDCNNVGPYFGFAYRVSERLGVVRANYGLHYGQIFPVTYGQIRLNPPGSVRLTVPQPSLLNPLGNLNVSNIPPGTPSSIFEFSRDFVTPYAHQYNLSWEPVLTRRVKLQFGYVGSRAHKLFQMWFGNRARITPNGTNADINQRRPNPRVLDHFAFLNASRGYYDAGRVSVIVTEWRGVSFDAAYWFSKSLDLGHDYTNTLSGPDGRVARSQTEFDVQGDLKGRSGFDQPHALLLRNSYQTPKLNGQARWLKGALGAWNFSLVSLFKNGTPFTVEAGSDAPGFGNVDGHSTDRPIVLDPTVLGRTIGNPDTSTQQLPRAAFRYLQVRDGETTGNLGRNTFRRSRIANVNAALARTWDIKAQTTLTFRAESINFFNTPQFAEPTKELTSPSFGKITNTLNDGRTFRFTLRLSF